MGCLKPLKVVGRLLRRVLPHLPLPDTFSNIVFHYDLLGKRLRELAFLNSGVRIYSRTSARVKRSCLLRGCRAFVEFLNQSKTPIARCAISGRAEMVSGRGGVSGTMVFKRVYTATQ